MDGSEALEALKKACRESANPKRLVLSSSNLAQSHRVVASGLTDDDWFKELDLADCFLGDDGAMVIVQALKTNTAITAVDMRGNNICCDGALSIAAMLRVNHSLARLCLEWNSVGVWDSGTRALADALMINSGLTELDLRNNRIGNDSALALALPLKRNTTLKRLDLRWNDIGMTGGAPLAEAMKTNTTMLALNLEGNNLGQELLEVINMALRRNQDVQRSAALQHEEKEHAVETLKADHEHELVAVREEFRAQEANLLARQSDVEYREKMAYEREQDALARLQHTTTQMTTGQKAFYELEAKLAEVVHARAVAEAKVRAMEAELQREKRDSATMIVSLQQDMLRERETRARLDERSRGQLEETDRLMLSTETKARELERRCEAKEQQIQDLREELVRARDGEQRRVRMLEERLSEAQDARVDADREQEERHDAGLSRLREDLISKVEEANERAKAADQRMRTAQEAARASEAQWSAEVEVLRARLKAQVAQAADDLDAVERKWKRDAEAERRQHAEHVRAVEQSQADMQARVDDLTRQMSRLQSELVSVSKSREEDSARARESQRVLEGELSRFKDERTEMQTEVSSSRQRYESAQLAARRTEAELRSELEGKNREMDRMRADFDSQRKILESRLSEKDAECRSAEGKLQARERDIVAIVTDEESQLADFQNNITQYMQSHVSGKKSKLQALRKLSFLGGGSP